MNKIVRSSECYLKVVPNISADIFEFGPIIKGRDNNVTGKRGNSERIVVQLGCKYEVNAAVIQKKVPAVFYGCVWYDDNANSKIDEGEGGVQDVQVWLYRHRKTADGKITFVKVKSRIVKKDGSFELPLNAIIEDSEYYLKFIHNLTADYKFGPIVKGGDNGITNERGNLERRTVKCGKRHQVNAGLIVKEGAIFFGRMWLDENGNGKIDKNEKGVEGARISLFRRASDEKNDFVK